MTTEGWRVTLHGDVDETVRLLGSEGFERSPFQDAAWMSVWRRTLGAAAGVESMVVAVTPSSGGAPVLVLPLVRERRRGVVRLGAWDRGVGDYNGPLAASGFALSSGEFDRLWAAILAVLPPADLVEIEKGPARIGAAVNPFAAPGRAVRSAFSGHPLPLETDFARTAEARLDGTMRRSLARKRKKLAAKGRLAFVVETGPVAVDGLERILAWRARRFPNAAETGADGRVWDFYRRLVAETAIARVATLSLDDQPIAGCFGTLTGSSFQLVAIGHDARFDNWSAGLLAIETMLEWATGAGVDVFDFTVGEEPYKKAFGVDATELFDFVEPLTAKGRLYLFVRRLRRRLGVLRRALRDRGRRPV